MEALLAGVAMVQTCNYIAIYSLSPGVPVTHHLERDRVHLPCLPLSVAVFSSINSGFLNLQAYNQILEMCVDLYPCSSDKIEFVN